MEQEAAQFLRALRGRRSQVAWARRLGYRGNPMTNWERGKRFPTAQEVLRAAGVAGHDVGTRFLSFAPTAPLEPAPDGYALAAWLDRLRGGASIVELAQRSGQSRFSVRRWLLGEAEPRLPDFFRLLDALTGRLPEWVAAFVPIEGVPSLAERHRRVLAAKRVAFDAPWSEAILRLLETTHFERLRRHDVAMVAESCGIELVEAQRCLDLLLESGIVTRARGKYKASGALSVDTQGGRAALQRLKAHWANVAAQRLLEAPRQQDLFAYNVISLAEADLDRVREILRAAYREIRTLVAASEPSEAVALVNLQLLELVPRRAS
jgi:transcriptional regulator with XRE-family HTH domain